MKKRPKRFNDSEHYADHYPDNHEKFKRRKRGKKQGKGGGDERAMKQELGYLLEEGYFDRIVSEMRSGKEATVFIVGKDTLEGEIYLAAKVYKSMESRGFQRDEMYMQGRWIADKKLERAIGKRSTTGKAAQQAMWVAHEYHQMWQLYNADLAVPKPMIGPEHDDIAKAGRIVLMELVGEGAIPAPRLADLRFDAEDKADIFSQSLELLRGFYQLGLVHGDFSTYNLLWLEGKVIAIDFPQMVNVKENKEAPKLLRRDVLSLITSLGVDADTDEVFASIVEESDD